MATDTRAIQATDMVTTVATAHTMATHHTAATAAMDAATVATTTEPSKLTRCACPTKSVLCSWF